MLCEGRVEYCQQRVNTISALGLESAVPPSFCVNAGLVHGMIGKLS